MHQFSQIYLDIHRVHMAKAKDADQPEVTLKHVFPRCHSSPVDREINCYCIVNKGANTTIASIRPANSPDK